MICNHESLIWDKDHWTCRHCNATGTMTPEAKRCHKCGRTNLAPDTTGWTCLDCGKITLFPPPVDPETKCKKCGKAGVVWHQGRQTLYCVHCKSVEPDKSKGWRERFKDWLIDDLIS